MDENRLIVITRPADGESLCRTRYFAHAQKGYRESEEIIFCAFGWGPLRKVPFKVSDCTDYRNLLMPTRKEMEQIARIIPTEPKRKVGGSAGMGFVTESAGESAGLETEDDDELVSVME
jgi:hypothetical protein